MSINYTKLEAKDTVFSANNILEFSGKSLSLHGPVVMGILNITPDSFFDGGKHQSDTAILTAAENMLQQGASIIDIGGQSTRPGADEVSEAEETKRVLHGLNLIIKEFPNALVSIDTFRGNVAKSALEAGAFMINDISAGNIDASIVDVVCAYNCPYVFMHMRGTPQTMTRLTDYEDVIDEVFQFFKSSIERFEALGIQQLIPDPGFGFAKTMEQNYQLLNSLEKFQSLQKTLLVGVSRKSMIYKKLDITPNEALNGTTVLNTVALQKGAGILRVHDVKEAMEAIALTNALQG